MKTKDKFFYFLIKMFGSKKLSEKLLFKMIKVIEKNYEKAYEFFETEILCLKESIDKSF